MASLKELAFNAINTELPENYMNIELIDTLSKGVPNREAKIGRATRKYEIAKINHILDLVHEFQRQNGFEQNDDIIRFRTDINGKQQSIFDVLDYKNIDIAEQFISNYLSQYPAPARRQLDEQGRPDYGIGIKKQKKK